MYFLLEKVGVLADPSTVWNPRFQAIESSLARETRHRKGQRPLQGPPLAHHVRDQDQLLNFRGVASQPRRAYPGWMPSNMKSRIDQIRASRGPSDDERKRHNQFYLLVC